MSSNDLPKPEFNAGIDYLETMSLLQKTLHKQNILRDYEGMYYTLLSLQIEIMGRIKSKQLKEFEQRIKPLEINCTKLIISGTNKNSFILHRSLIKWFEQLTIIRHELGLVMPDKNSAWEEIGNV
jgi:hypothetical protein